MEQLKTKEENENVRGKRTLKKVMTPLFFFFFFAFRKPVKLPKWKFSPGKG